MRPDHSAVQALMAGMDQYFEGLYQADPSRLRAIFHPQARYINATPGDEVQLDLEAYLEQVAQRVAPAATQDARHEAVLSLHVDDTMAFICARMAMMGRQYLDYLTWIKFGEEWRLVSKVFTYTTNKEA